MTSKALPKNAMTYCRFCPKRKDPAGFTPKRNAGKIEKNGMEIKMENTTALLWWLRAFDDGNGNGNVEVQEIDIDCEKIWVALVWDWLNRNTWNTEYSIVDEDAMACLIFLGLGRWELSPSIQDWKQQLNGNETSLDWELSRTLPLNLCTKNYQC